MFPFGQGAFSWNADCTPIALAMSLKSSAGILSCPKRNAAPQCDLLLMKYRPDVRLDRRLFCSEEPDMARSDNADRRERLQWLAIRIGGAWQYMTNASPSRRRWTGAFFP